MQYRRLFTPGGCYFFTLVTAQRQPVFCNKAAINALYEAFSHIRKKHPFKVDAFVLLPDHLHCIWTLPPDDHDFATRWRLIKTWFTKHYESDLCSGKSPWQQRYWEHLLRDDLDYQHHVEYIHYNPVKHGYVQRPLDLPHSSFQRYFLSGIYPEDWGSNGVQLPEDTGGE